MLALPLLLWLFGDQGGLPALLIITLDVVVFSSVTVLLELARGGRHSATRARIVLQAARSVAVNPIIMGTALGILCSLAGLPLPAVVHRTLTFIGQAAAPAALFALGATLSLRRLGGSLGPVGAMIACKLFLHPLLAFLVFGWLLGLDRLWVNAGVIFAACPVGLNVYVFAQHDEVGIETASSAVLISTALAMLTITGLPGCCRQSRPRRGSFRKPVAGDPVEAVRALRRQSVRGDGLPVASQIIRRVVAGIAQRAPQDHPRAAASGSPSGHHEARSAARAPSAASPIAAPAPGNARA